MAQTASQCFDISVWQFFVALLVGGKVQIVGQEDVHDPEGLLRVLDATAVTVWETVPSMLEAMLGEGRQIGERLEGQRWVVVTGEAARSDCARDGRGCTRAIAMLNGYGPTECSDDVTHYAMEEGWDAEEMRQVPIGRPVMNTEVYVLDGEGEPVPVGVKGELYIGGEGVGRGYWKRAELTAERFIGDRYGSRKGGRLYRTGDVARWGLNGDVEFLGKDGSSGKDTRIPDRVGRDRDEAYRARSGERSGGDGARRYERGEEACGLRGEKKRGG